MEEVRKDADKIIETLDSLLYYNSDELNRLQREDNIKEGFDIGLKQGLEQGIEQGLEQGIEQGILQGKEESRMEIAKKLLEMNTDINKISEITGLQVEEINKMLDF